MVNVNFPSALLLTDEEKNAIRHWVAAVDADYAARIGKKMNALILAEMADEDCSMASPITFRISASGIGDCKSALYRQRVLAFGYDDDGTFFTEPTGSGLDGWKPKGS